MLGGRSTKGVTPGRVVLPGGKAFPAGPWSETLVCRRDGPGGRSCLGRCGRGRYRRPVRAPVVGVVGVVADWVVDVVAGWVVDAVAGWVVDVVSGELPGT
jgi:hypothetical protein